MNGLMGEPGAESLEPLRTLAAELLEMKERSASTLRELQANATHLQGELERLVASIREIEARRIEAQAKLNLVLDDLQRATDDANHERRRIVLSRLRRDARALFKAATLGDPVARLAAEREALLQADPALARSYADYLAGKEILAGLSAVPTHLAAAHQALEAQVAHVIAFDGKMTSAQQSTSVLSLESLLHCTERILHVLLPVNLLEADEDETLAALQENFAEAVWTALVETVRYSNASPIDFVQEAWQGYLCLTILFDADFESASLARQFTGYLIQTFESLDTLPFRICLSTVLVDDEIWMQEANTALPEERLDVMEPFDEEEVAPEEQPDAASPLSDGIPREEGSHNEISRVEPYIVQAGEHILAAESLRETAFADSATEEVLPSASTVNGFFTRRDLVSWNRPLRSVQGSKWNQRARRVRTLLMRMAGTGQVGAASTARMNSLLVDLPERDRDDLADAIEMMTAVGFLHKMGDADERVIALAPERLEEIASLINRDVTAGWVGIVRQA